MFEAFFLLVCWLEYVCNLLRTSRDSVSVQSAEFFLGILSPENQNDMLSRKSVINYSRCYQNKNCVELSFQYFTLQCGAWASSFSLTIQAYVTRQIKFGRQYANCSGDQIEENEAGGSCRTYGGE